MAVCPMCGHTSEGFTAADSSAELEELNPDDEVCCRHVISENPFAECSFTASRWQLDVPWLRLAGVGGTPNAGQTTWNAACAHKLRPFLIAEGVSLEPLPSCMQDNLQKDWDSIEQDRVWPRATELYGPDPYPWCAAVRPRTRRSSLSIVAISDFAGETLRMTQKDGMYRSLLNKDGHFFFIDLAERERTQLELFHRFLVNLRASLGLRNRARRLSPIAICIGKLDRLPKLQYEPEKISRAKRCIQEIQDSGPTDDATILGAILHRHDLILKYSELFPCVKSLNGRLLDECGKGRFAFFPMATVGWLGGGDLRAADTIAPFGVIDPLLWILHASGMEVLPSRPPTF